MPEPKVKSSLRIQRKATKPETLEAFHARIQEICPGARIEAADPTGELVVYTGLRHPHSYRRPLLPFED